jgi:hypothetical protein
VEAFCTALISYLTRAGSALFRGRMAALGFKFVGPQAPNGRRAEPWPKELPRAS